MFYLLSLSAEIVTATATVTIKKEVYFRVLLLLPVVVVVTFLD